MEIIFLQVAILIMSVVIHEVSHGLAAYWLGDPTAKYAGRLTLNPLKHLDLWGSFVVPVLMIMTLGVGFGWAKPVPYNPYNLRNQKYGSAIVGAAGPLSNILIALVFGFFLRVLLITGSISIGDSSLAMVFFTSVIMINILLAFFNLIPFPPLDGSKILFAVLPISEETKLRMEQFGFIFLFLIIFLLIGPISVFLNFMQDWFFRVVVGM